MPELNRIEQLEKGCGRNIFRFEEQDGEIWHKCKKGDLCQTCRAELKGRKETTEEIIRFVKDSRHTDIAYNRMVKEYLIKGIKKMGGLK